MGLKQRSKTHGVEVPPGKTQYRYRTSRRPCPGEPLFFTHTQTPTHLPTPGMVSDIKDLCLTC